MTFRLGVNLLLIQSWFPVSEIRNSFNMVSWYLSVCAFLYFLFPWIIRKVAKYQGKMQAACNLGFMVLVQFAAGYLLNEMVHMYGGNENLVQGLTYNFPLYRMFDFVIGCDLGYLYFYSDKGKKGKYHFVTEKEAAVLCLEIWNLALVHYYSQIAWSGWWWRTNPHILTSCLLIYIFVKNQGGLTRFCNNRYLIYLGNISGVTFLIHELVLRYIGFIFRYCGIELNRWVLATIVFLLTVVLAQMWQKRSFLQNGNENIV